MDEKKEETEMELMEVAVNEEMNEEIEVEPEVVEEEEEEEEDVDSNGISLKDKIKPEVLDLVNQFGDQFYSGNITRVKCNNVFHKVDQRELYEANKNNMYVKDVNVGAAVLAYTNNLEKHGLLLEYDTYGMNDPNANTDHPPINNMAIFASTTDSSLGLIITYDPDQKKVLNSSTEWLQIPFVVLSNEQVIESNGSVKINGLRPTTSSTCKCFIVCRCQPVSSINSSNDNSSTPKRDIKAIVEDLLKLKTHGEIIDSMNDTSVYQLLIDNKERFCQQNILNFFIDYINSVTVCSVDRNKKLVAIEKKTQTRNEFMKNKNTSSKSSTRDIFMETRQKLITSYISSGSSSSSSSSSNNI